MPLSTEPTSTSFPDVLENGFDVAIDPPKTAFSGGLQVSLGKFRTEDYGVQTQTPLATRFTPLRSLLLLLH